jgi:heme A synthase
MAAFYFGIATVVTTFLLLLVGGTVNPSGSSLACPDWPTCYGTFFPRMEGGILYEHGHRIMGTLVGALTVFWNVTLWVTRRPQKTHLKLAAAALAMVILQGVLGGITVIYKLPAIVSTSHLGLSMIFFLFISYLTWRLYPPHTDAQGRVLDGVRVPQPLRTPAVVALGAVYGQILLGAVVRHTKSGRACLNDWPLCTDGVLWPAWGPAQVHMVHRIFGVVAFVIVLWASAKTFSAARRFNKPVAGTAAFIAPVLCTIQVALGVLTVHTFIGVPEAVAHLGGGALLLLNCFALHLGLSPESIGASDGVVVDAVGPPLSGVGATT